MTKHRFQPYTEILGVQDVLLLSADLFLAVKLL